MAGQEGAPGGTRGGGARGGSRRAAKPKRRVRADLAMLGLGALVCLVAWGALVWAAVDFGRSARGGESGKWSYLAAASVGAVACLFLCLWLITVALRRIGILEEKRPHRH